MVFDREVFGVESGFTVLTILAFGTLTLTLHAELLRGDRAALSLALFIGMYWTVRILVDAFYFSHEDWPQGRRFLLGHVFLTSFFWGLGVDYFGLFFWHLRSPSYNKTPPHKNLYPYT